MAFTATIAEVIAGDKTGLLAKHPSWERVPLSEIASILNGAPFDSALFSTAQGFPLIRIRDVVSGSTSTFYTGPVEETFVVSRGEILVGMDGDFNAGFWGPTPALLNQRVCKITPNEIFYSKKLLSYALPGYLAAINAATPSITVKHLSSKTIAEIELPLPPHAEQTRIVEKLEELLSDLDAGVAELKASQAKLVRYRQSLLKAAVEGALTAEWRQHNTPKETGTQLLQRILTERRARWEAKQLTKFAEQCKKPPNDWQKKYPEPAQPDTRDLPELPEGWVWAALDQLLTQLRSGTPETSGRDITPHPVLKSSAVRQGAIDFSAVNFLDQDQCREDNYLETGDLLITRLSGSVDYVGCSAVVGELASRSVQYPDRIFCGKLALETPQLSSYVVNCMRSPIARERIQTAAKSTAGHKRISLSDLLPFPVPLPPPLEIVELERMLGAGLMYSDELGAVAEISLKQSTAQRKNILRAAFSGQLVPQDPNDEPASALLARIRAQRETDSRTPARTRGRKAKDTA